MTRPESSAADGAYHDVHLTEEPARALVWQEIAAYLAKWIPGRADVLEVGAGYCCWINAVRAARRVAVDVWPDLPRHAASGVEPLVMNAATGLSALGEEQFDVVLASNVLEHFDADAASALVGDVYRLLRPGGRIIIVQPNFRHAYRSYFDDYTHRSVFTDVSLANLLRARGFRVVRVMPKFMPYSMRNTRLPIARWAIRAYLRSPVKPFAGQMLVIAERP
jgi:SAM-dependent methyltransferase